MDRYMRKAIPNDMQKAAPYIPGTVPYETDPPITRPSWPGAGPNKFWLSGAQANNTGDYR